MNITQSVIELKEKHAGKWRDKSQAYWAWRLTQEVFELLGALLGLHAGPVEWELMQISSICMNWLEARNPQVLPTMRAADSAVCTCTISLGNSKGTSTESRCWFCGKPQSR